MYKNVLICIILELSINVAHNSKRVSEDMISCLLGWHCDYKKNGDPRAWGGATVVLNSIQRHLQVQERDEQGRHLHGHGCSLHLFIQCRKLNFET